MTSETTPPPVPKAERPRDELGRPLPAGSENRLLLPDFDALNVEENHALAIELFNARNFFGAHEAWETCWVQSKGAELSESGSSGRRIERSIPTPSPPSSRAT